MTETKPASIEPLIASEVMRTVATRIEALIGGHFQHDPTKVMFAFITDLRETAAGLDVWAAAAPWPIPPAAPRPSHQGERNLAVEAAALVQAVKGMVAILRRWAAAGNVAVGRAELEGLAGALRHVNAMVEERLEKVLLELVTGVQPGEPTVSLVDRVRQLQEWVKSCPCDKTSAATVCRDCWPLVQELTKLRQDWKAT